MKDLDTMLDNLSMAIGAQFMNETDLQFRERSGTLCNLVGRRISFDYNAKGRIGKVEKVGKSDNNGGFLTLLVQTANLEPQQDVVYKSFSIAKMSNFKTLQSK